MIRLDELLIGAQANELFPAIEHTANKTTGVAV
jgi:hypothetical protein